MGSQEQIDVLSEHGLEPVKAIKTGVGSWKPYMVSDGLRLVNVDLFELYTNSMSQTRRQPSISPQNLHRLDAPRYRHRAEFPPQKSPARFAPARYPPVMPR